MLEQEILDRLGIGVIRTLGPVDSYRITDVSPVWCHVMGYVRDAVLGCPGGAFLHGPDTDPNTVQRIELALDRRETVQYTTRFGFPNGVSIWCHVTCMALPCGGRAGTVKDVTMQRNKEMLYDSLIDSAQIPIVECDCGMQITRTNRASEHVFRYRTDELVGQNVGLLMSCPQSFEPMPVGRVVRGMRKDMKKLDLWMTVTTVPDGHAFMFVDMTETVQKTKQLAEASATLAAERHLNDFLAHEVRNPLSVAINCMRYIEAGIPNPSQRVERDIECVTAYPVIMVIFINS